MSSPQLDQGAVMKRIILGAFAALALAAAVPGAALAQAQKPTEHQLDLAHQIIDASGVSTTVGAQIRTLMSGLIIQQLGANTPEQQKIVDRAISILMPKLIERVTVVYAGVYSEQELTDILAFYKSPAGKAMVAKQPEAMAKAGQAGASMAPEIEAAFREALSESRT
jgi:hypothetical protein